MIRSTLEIILKDKTRKRHMPNVVGGLPIHVSTAGGLRQLFYPMNTVDPDLLETAISLIRKGDTVWDIGANVGLFSIAALGLTGSTGTVLSFEPDTKLIDLLRKNALLNRKKSGEMQVIPAGVAGETGIRTFNIAKRARASNALAGYGNTQTGGTRVSQSIVCLSLNDCIATLPKPDVIKIDVEGAEQEILEASKTLFTSIRPRMAIEVSQTTRGAITRLLKNNDYHMFDASRPFEKSLEVQETQWNTLAIPSEQMDKVFNASSL